MPEGESEDLLQPYIAAFHAHSDRMCQVARFLAASSPETRREYRLHNRLHNSQGVVYLPAFCTGTTGHHRIEVRFTYKPLHTLRSCYIHTLLYVYHSHILSSTHMHLEPPVCSSILWPTPASSYRGTCVAQLHWAVGEARPRVGSSDHHKPFGHQQPPSCRTPPPAETWVDQHAQHTCHHCRWRHRSNWLPWGLRYSRL